MKKHLVFSMIAAAALTACQPEHVAPKSEASQPQHLTFECEAPYVHYNTLACPGPAPDPYTLPYQRCSCKEPVVSNLVSSTGSSVIDYPTPSTLPWGQAEVQYGFPGDAQGYAIYLGLNGNYLIERVDYLAGPCGAVNLNGGIPIQDPGWSTYVPQNRTSCVTFDAGQLPVGCGCLTMLVTATRYNFFGSPIPASRRTLLFENTGAATDDNVLEICHEGCPPPPPVVTQLTAGTCAGCDSYNEVTFWDCDSMRVSSCQNIAKIEVFYTDCSNQQLVSVGTGTSLAAPAGKEFSHIYVKSGCNGPGNGRRFDAPCVNAACN